MPSQTRVVLVEDSDIFATLFEECVSSRSEIALLGRAADGKAGIELIKKLKPDVVLMDVQMPRMNGIDAVRVLRTSTSVPVLMMSAVGRDGEASMSFDAMRAGATDFVAKPSDERGFGRMLTRLTLLKRAIARQTAAQAAVQAAIANAPPANAPAPAVPETLHVAGKVRLVGIASSTGGPAALEAVLSTLPAHYDAPIAIVQHMSSGFESDLVEWLDKSTALRVALARPGERARPGRVYVATPGAHLVVDRRGVFRFDTTTPPREGHRPSGSVLFHSMVAAYGADCAGVVLTGMGDDGSDGLLALRDVGATTVAQDAASSTIDGMPRAARENGAARVVVPLSGVGTTLRRLISPSAAKLAAAS